MSLQSSGGSVVVWKSTHEVNSHVLAQTVFVENAQPTIPESLLECYRNSTLRSPENRLPMTIQTFIDLVRKVESYQKDTQDISTLAHSILHRFRMDGIELTPDVKETTGVVPYSVSGMAFFKHVLILTAMVPSNNYKFPNESLSQVELCTLHFMLSHTIERMAREDESMCGKLSNYVSGRSSRIPRDVRYRRQVEEEEKHMLTKPEEVEQTSTESMTMSYVSEDHTHVTEMDLHVNTTETEHNSNETLDTETDVVNKTKFFSRMLLTF
ncbi:hypothetical protein L9F63_018674, partial [Diploptera punctata]